MNELIQIKYLNCFSKVPTYVLSFTFYLHCNWQLCMRVQHVHTALNPYIKFYMENMSENKSYFRSPFGLQSSSSSSGYVCQRNWASEQSLIVHRSCRRHQIWETNSLQVEIRCSGALPFKQYSIFLDFNLKIYSTFLNHLPIIAWLTWSSSFVPLLFRFGSLFDGIVLRAGSIERHSTFTFVEACDVVILDFIHHRGLRCTIMKNWSIKAKHQWNKRS